MKNWKSVLTGILVFALLPAVAQDKYFTRTGKISFVSKGVIETISAKHNSVTCVLDTKSGQIQFAVLMRGFEFRKALMQEHFNENYVESDKYPKATFKGDITNNNAIDYSKEGTYNANVKGKLTLHGETRDVESAGTIVVKNGRLTASADFNILLSDYRIRIPAVVKDNISNTVNITVDCPMEPLKN